MQSRFRIRLLCCIFEGWTSSFKKKPGEAKTMISRSTIDRVMESARIEEVVGDFVTLKKRGINYLGLCPFHNEKTPSFNVNPTRGMYKCFGCGEAGNSVGFLMAHEHLSYPDAIRALAQRYNIEVEEDLSQPTPEQQQVLSERDRLYQLHAFAQSYFVQYLQSDDGQAIGLSYFRERGITDQSIQLFGLSYAPDNLTAFSDFARNSGYTDAEIVAAGLASERERGGLADRFRGRVLFPFYNLSGKVVGFGGRTLKNDKKEAKYLNSPETLLYKKSETLYGLFQAKKAIQKAENTFLVEGYTDVISLNQAGVENVVASSGTSLTQEQARLIRRFSKNVTVLYDGDAAGIKASLRGIDILLEHDLNVRVVLMPDGEDPDSQSRKLGPEGFQDYLRDEVKDFIHFKADLLFHGTENDPVQRAEAIHDIADSISRVSDPILRATYSTHTASLLHLDEQTLISEVNRQRLNKLKKISPDDRAAAESMQQNFQTMEAAQAPVLNDAPQEADIIRLLLLYATNLMSDTERPVIAYITESLDEIGWDNPVFEKIFRIYHEGWTQYQAVPDIHQLINHTDKEISAAAVDIYGKHYEISENWKKHDIFIVKLEDNVALDVVSSVNRINIKKIHRLLQESQQKIKEATPEELDQLIADHLELEKFKIQLAQQLGTVITR